MIRHRLGWGVALACMLAACAAFADGVIRDGVGAIASGRGGTNLAFADNGVLLLDNPAGMMNIAGCGLSEFGVEGLFTNLGYSDPDNPNGVSADDDPFPLAHFSLMRKSSDEIWAYGFGFFAPAGFGAQYTMEGPPALPGTRNYKSLGALGRFLPAGAVQLTERLSLGATLGVAVSHVELEGPYFLQSPGPLQGTPTMLDLQTTGAAPTWSVGLQYQLTDATTIGVTYQDETRFHLDGNARVEVDGIGHSYFDATLDFVWPRWLGIGARHAFLDQHIVAVDVVWFDWSHAFDHTDLLLEDAENPVFAAILGGGYNDRFPLNWRDSVSPRVGYEFHTLDGRVLRAGYVYHRNPIPDRTLTPFIQATLEHSVSVGYGQLVGDWELNAAYQYSFAPDRTVDDSDVVGDDFALSRVETEAHWANVSLLRRF